MNQTAQNSPTHRSELCPLIIVTAQNSPTHQPQLNFTMSHHSPLHPPTMTEVHGDCRDVGLRHSAEKQRNSAFSHFNHFLKSHCPQIGVDIVDVQSIPFEGIPKQETNKDIALFWDEMMGAWITHLGVDARLCCKADNEGLSPQSASNCNSAVKKHFVDKFRGESLPAFQPVQWSRFLRILQGFFNEDKRKNPKLQKNGGMKTKTSTHEDREALATGCIWIGMAGGAEF